MNLVTKLLSLALVAFTASATSGCAYVTSSTPTLSAATGETWYTKDTFFIILIDSSVYYCPKGGGVCYEAEIID